MKPAFFKGPEYVPDTPRPWLSNMRDVAKEEGKRVYLAQCGEVAERYTFSSFVERAEKLARGLVFVGGLHRGDVLAVVLPGKPDLVCLSFFAAASVGVIFNNVNPLLPAVQKKSHFAIVQPRMIITTESEFEACKAAVAGLPQVVIVTVSSSTATCGVLLSDLLMERDDPRVVVPAWDAAVAGSQMGSLDIALYACTGGSTAGPKVCPWSYRAVSPAAMQMGICRETQVVPVPLHSTLGAKCFIAAFFNRNTLVLPHGFSAEAMMRIIREHHATFLAMVPEMATAILACRKQEEEQGRSSQGLEQLRLVFLAGAPAPPDLLQHMMDVFSLERCWTGYGMTEASHMYASPSGNKKEGATLGLGVELKITDDAGALLPVGVRGHIMCRTPNSSNLYLRDEEKSKETFMPDGWINTGDNGYFDEYGRLHFTGRSKDMIKRSGQQVWPAEVEAVLGKDPAVQCSAVVGVPDVLQGETVAAFVVPVVKSTIVTAEGRHAFAASLRKYAESNMLPVSVPQYTFCLPELPLVNHSGKVDKVQLGKLVPSLLQQLWVDQKAEMPPEQVPTSETSKRIAHIWADVIGVPEDTISLDADFYLLGGSSMAAVHVASALAKFYPSAEPGFLTRCPTIRLLECALESKATPAAESAIDWSSELRLPADVAPRVGATLAAFPPRAIFVTGGTGFLGAHVLAEIIAHTPSSTVISCLVRSSDPAEGRLRLAQAMKTNLLGDAYEAILANRVELVCGDLSLERFGLKQDAFDALAASVDVIYHVGALVHWSAPYHILKPANVMGTVEVLRLACGGSKLVPVHHVSTIEVAHYASRYCSETEPLTDTPPPSILPYVVSKWAAEKLIEVAKRRGIPVTVYRPSFVGGSTVTGAFNGDDYYWKLLKGSVQLGQHPAWAKAPFVVSPVNGVAEVIRSASQLAASTTVGKVLHLISQRPLSFADLFHAAVDFGYDMREEDPSTWLKAAEASGSDSPLAPLQFMLRATTAQVAAPGVPLAATRAAADAMLGHDAVDKCLELNAAGLLPQLELAVATVFMPVPTRAGAPTLDECRLRRGGSGDNNNDGEWLQRVSRRHVR
eukprot:TRINITY_DN3227_c0_g1_i1.p1 TRINITY_DN3227_c0_g1~~TRINITY_DN3227_c0_g1_i1.p1  ORF type:complete len:1077 (-),score=254.37 TRINITY_DN3227_c0_g1_i1:1801-5031(-)